MYPPSPPDTLCRGVVTLSRLTALPALHALPHTVAARPTGAGLPSRSPPAPHVLGPSYGGAPRGSAPNRLVRSHAFYSTLHNGHSRGVIIPMAHVTALCDVRTPVHRMGQGGCWTQ